MSGPLRHLLGRARDLGAALAFGILSLLFACDAMAGTMTHESLVQRFPSPFIVGKKDAALPVWPLFRQNATATELVAYVFESIDMAPVPGFSGVPINMLIALDPKGNFLEVKVIGHHEPVFLDGLGEAPMFRFAEQYKGLSLTDNITIDSAPRNGPRREGSNIHIDGVAKATASVRIINQSVLAAALKVARKKLGFSGARDPDQIARIKPDVFQALNLPQLLDKQLIGHVVLKNAAVEQAFKGTPAAGIDAEALARPDEVFAEVYVAHASVPEIGRNLLSPRAWQKLAARLDPGDHAIVVMWRGRYGVVGEDFVRGTVPDRLILKQGGLPIEMRDLDLDLTLAAPAALPGMSIKAFRVIAQAGLDPAHALDFGLHVKRAKGIIYPERFSKEFNFTLQLPERYYTAAESDNKTWLAIWKQRWAELALLAAGLAVLSIALIRQAALTRDARRFAWFRNAYLLYTTLFIGWYAQGQLSIVNLTGLLQALKDGRSLSFFLYDPMTVSLWAYVLVSLLVWGRGTFCGWLCPFGALQEFTARLGRLLRIPQIPVRAATDARLKLIKYALLAGILAAALFSAELTDRLVEAEPFKTAITLNFVRAWPFVLYAVALLLLSATIYKFFCRYLCPFGAGLAVLGRLRILDWLPRRAECGTPCQTCRHRCDYEAIRPNGTIRYDDCFQCMDCVVIYQSDDKCAPLLLEKKRARTIPIHAESGHLTHTG